VADEWRDRIAQSAAELSVTAGEWIIREGEAPSFFVLLNGSLVCEKDYGGTNKVGVPYGPGDFYGEIPILLDSVSIASLRATEASRLLRLDAVQFKDMITSSRRCNELVVDIMGGRPKVISDHMQDNDPLRVLVVGSQFNKECHAVRAFLSQNHIAYRWSDRDQPTVQPGGCKGEPFGVVDSIDGCGVSSERS
jgi:thioredoxin reductase (NADPH)